MIRFFNRLASKCVIKLRLFYFRKIGCSIGHGVIFEKNVSIYYKPEKVFIGHNVSIEEGTKLIVSNLAENNCAITIGDNTFIGRYSTIVAKENTRIGKNVLIAPFCYITEANHGMDKNGPMRDQAQNFKGVTIGDDVWLGNGVTVLPGVEIGQGAVIGAGSVVTKSIPPNAIAGGIPARIIRFR